MPISTSPCGKLNGWRTRSALDWSRMEPKFGSIQMASSSTAGTSLSYSAAYSYLDEALRARWPGFVALRGEMQAFVPRPKSDFAIERAKIREQLVSVGVTGDLLETMTDKQLEGIAAARVQWFVKFHQRHTTEYVTVLMLSHALCEAIINAILAIGLAERAVPELFDIIERAELKQKWTTSPKAINAEYDFPKGHAISETLSKLIRQRNSIVHSKISLTIGSKLVHKGVEFERETVPKEVAWIERFFSLPYDLDEFISPYMPMHAKMMLGSRAPVNAVPMHKVMVAKKK